MTVHSRPRSILIQPTFGFTCMRNQDVPASAATRAIQAPTCISNHEKSPSNSVTVDDIAIIPSSVATKLDIAAPCHNKSNV